MSQKKARRWYRYGYLGTLGFPRSALINLSKDEEFSAETRNMALQIEHLLVKLSSQVRDELAAIDQKKESTDAKGK